MTGRRRTPVIEALRELPAEEEEALAADPTVLFGSFSTTGSGHGLQIVTYLVGSAYGVPDARELVEDGYIGARLRDDVFSTWFHWPLAGA